MIVPQLNHASGCFGRSPTSSGAAVCIARLALAALTAFAPALCAAQTGDSPQTVPQAHAGNPDGFPGNLDEMLESLRARADRDAAITQALSRSHDLLQEGRSLCKNGDKDAGRTKLSLARQAILALDEDAFYEPAVHEYFLEIGRTITALGVPGGPQPGSVAPWIKGPFLTDPGLAGIDFDSHPEVRHYIGYFNGRGRQSVRLAFSRLGAYESMMRKVFREEGVPEELIFLGLVESDYNPYARSTVGAAGIWQFVRETGARYGLEQTGQVDERHDPQKSTRAAARYLADLYHLFGDWSLALAAYNAGEQRILRLLQRTGAKDFWQLSRSGLLPPETVNYVPAVLAAIAIGTGRADWKK